MQAPVQKPPRVGSNSLRLSPFVAISILLFGTVIWGFWRTYFLPLISLRADRSWLIHIHAAVFVGWMLLLLIQSFAVSFGKGQFHRRLGVFGMAYAVAVFLVGIVISVAVPVAGARAGNFSSEIAGLVAIYLISDMLVFAMLMVGAFRCRTRPAAHKRWVICATVALTTAAVGRVLPGGSLSFYLAWLAPVFLLIVVDLVTLKRASTVSLAGLMILTFAFFKNGLIEQLAVARELGLVVISPWM